MRWMMVIAALGLVSCGDGDSNNTTANNTTANNTTANNTSANNTSANNTSANNTTANNTTANNTTANNTTCSPLTCEQAGASCGTVDDGCGATIECGTCVGQPCAADDDCAADLSCFAESSAGWTGGHCQKDCASDADCGAGSHCNDGTCLKTCSDDTDCRGPDYGCWDGSEDGVSECLPLGTGAGAVGDPCTSYADCAGGQTGACIVEEGEDFVGGYCTITGCSVDAGCAAGTNCLDATTPAICLLNCMSDDDCRADYQCSMVTEVGTSCVPASL